MGREINKLWEQQKELNSDLRARPQVFLRKPMHKLSPKEQLVRDRKWECSGVPAPMSGMWLFAIRCLPKPQMFSLPLSAPDN
jgi:hypothetical protein